MYLYINKPNLTIDAFDDSRKRLIASVPTNIICLNIAKLLFENPEKTYNRELLIKSASLDKTTSFNSLSINIMQLRKNLVSINSRIEIKCHPTRGYKLVLPDDINILQLQSNEVDKSVTAHNLRKQEEKSQKHSKFSLIYLSPIILGDIFLSVLILTYTCALYCSLYHI